jgi:nitrate/nitrite transporter NarK
MEERQVEYFSIFQICLLFNLHSSISFHNSTYFSSTFSISFHYSTYFPSMENIEENSEKTWKLWKKDKFNSETIWKIQKKMVKRYGRKVSWIVFLPYFSVFSSVFSISFHISTCLSSVFSISFHYSTWLSSIISISFHFSSIRRKVGWIVKWYGRMQVEQWTNLENTEEKYI